MVAKKTASKKTIAKVVKKVAVKKVVKKVPPKKVTVKKAAPKKIIKKVTPKKIVKKVAPKKVVKKAAPKKVVKKAAPKKVVQPKVVKSVAPKKAVIKKITKNVSPKKIAVEKIEAKGNTPKMNKKEIEKFQKILLSMKAKLYHDIHDIEDGNLKKSQRDITGDLSGYSLHLADMGTENFDRELALNLASQESNILYEVDRALRRIDDDIFGICECGKKIQEKRLQAVPYASLCIACKELEESESKMRFE